MIAERADTSDDRRAAVIAVGVVGLTISTLAVILRFAARLGRINKVSFWWDDWAILVTLVFSQAFLALSIAWTNYGLGMHYVDVPYADALPSNYLSHAAITLYAVSIWGVKISTLLLYARLFQHYVALNVALWVFGAISTAWFVCTAVVPWFNCTPVAKTLNIFLPGVCPNRMPWFQASAFINAFLDLAILLLPMPTIVRLNMNLRKKIWLAVVFTLGYCSAFLSFARFFIIMLDPLVMSTAPAADPTYHMIPMELLSMLEAPVAILAICGPAIGQLLARALKDRNFTSLFKSFFSIRGSSGASAPDGDLSASEEPKTSTSTLSRHRTRSQHSHASLRQQDLSWSVPDHDISVPDIHTTHTTPSAAVLPDPDKIDNMV